ncbi:unnamed protein product [Echinostoma caproni]|uniref:Protein TSSC4 n=1 Tax=Echinostoma caproni TaxID=27848 RepID=A0A183B5M0_9TREM|nr:unnamed protein product [Echinostoma caproni]
MARPEAALCARLQSQGWKLPDDIISKLTEDLRDTRLSEGISCFIDHVDEEDASSSNSTEDEANDLECTCGLSSEYVSLSGENPSVNVKERALCSDEVMGKIKARSVTEELVFSKLLSCLPPNESGCNTADSTILKHSSVDHQMGTATEYENTSEASGDDLTSPTGNMLPKASLHAIFCPKHRRTKAHPGTRMKHLAPPKPPRLFLLSPPASPPVGWEPKAEAEPVINYDLLEALAALAPGEAFELHPRDEVRRHPSIVITPCENHPSSGPRPQIVQTPCPERRT